MKLKGLAQQLTDWQLHEDSQGIVFLALDRCAEKTNTLSEGVLLELQLVLNTLQQCMPTGLVISSAKETGFIAGADIREFDHFTNVAEVAIKIRQGQGVLMQLEKLACPTVAAVSGFCLGGGLELALCCDTIIAQDTPTTRIGLPEINLGIYPGLGGSVRLPDKIGGLQALALMLTGRLLKVRAAKSLGIIDQVIGVHDSLHWHARKAILQKSRSKGSPLIAKLSNTKLLRQILARTMIKKAKSKASPEHYPAPYELINNWKNYFDSRDLAFEKEAESVAKLMLSETSVNLRRVYHLMERLKNLGKKSSSKLKRIHIVGAGVMGGDIASWSVLQGMEVTLQDHDKQKLQAVVERSGKLFSQRLRSKSLIAAAKSRLIIDINGHGVKRADIVIEAIFEDLKAKQTLLKQLEPQLKPSAILCSNTSSLSIDDIAISLQNPACFIGLHFFNPVAKMPLIEVIKGKASSSDAIELGCSFCTQINRFPLPVKNSPGFLVNRVLMPYMLEALYCYNEGFSMEVIDKAAEEYGMPIGPVELADTIGLDVCLKVLRTLIKKDISLALLPLESLVTQGKLGKKTSQGFYQWKNSHKLSIPTNFSREDSLDLGERLMKPFLDECILCETEKVVEDAGYLDAGIIFGTGFAPYKGGPLQSLGRGYYEKSEH